MELYIELLQDVLVLHDDEVLLHIYHAVEGIFINFLVFDHIAHLPIVSFRVDQLHKPFLLHASSWRDRPELFLLSFGHQLSVLVFLELERVINNVRTVLLGISERNNMLLVFQLHVTLMKLMMRLGRTQHFQLFFRVFVLSLISIINLHILFF